MKSAILLGAVVSALASGSSLAGTPPRADLSTDVIAPYVPAGWKNSTLKGGGGGAELAEFTPTGLPTDAFTDLVGYTRQSLRPGTVIPHDYDFAAPTRANLPTHCSASAIREFKPAGAPPEWHFVQTFCVLNSGASAGKVDVTFDAFRVRPTALFSTWRAWRGTPDEFRRFLADTAKVNASALVTVGGATTFDERVVDRAAPTILKAWASTFTKVEICDLGVGEICPSFRASSSALPPSVIGSLTLNGSNELTTTQALEVQAKMSDPYGAFGRDILAKMKSDDRLRNKISFAQSISLSNHDWASPNSIMAAIIIPALGARSNGGSLVAVDETPAADPATRARMQAYLVLAAHILWRLGVAPDRETITIAPPR